MKIRILDEAQSDLREGAQFYEREILVIKQSQQTAALKP